MGCTKKQLSKIHLYKVAVIKLCKVRSVCKVLVPLLMWNKQTRDIYKLDRLIAQGFVILLRLYGLYVPFFSPRACFLPVFQVVNKLAQDSMNSASDNDPFPPVYTYIFEISLLILMFVLGKFSARRYYSLLPLILFNQ